MVLTAVLAVGARRAFALGQLPLLTDETDTPRPQALKVDVAYAFDVTRSAAGGVARRGRLTRRDMSVPVMQLNYGMTDRLQARLEGRYGLTTGSTDESPAVGFGDLSAGVKYRFLDQQDSPEDEEDAESSPDEDPHGWSGPVSASIFPQLTFPTGSRRDALGDGEYSLFTPLDVGREIGKLTLLAEAAFFWRYHRRSGPNELQLGTAAYYALTEKLYLLGEQRVHLPTVGHATAQWLVNLGAWYDVTEHLAVYGAAGRGVRASDRAEQSDLLLTIGVEVLFGAPR